MEIVRTDVGFRKINADTKEGEIMEKICDLHTHSTYSDGTLTPRELVLLAQERGISAIALTDHNTIAGLPEFLDEADQSEVRAVTGVEFSTDYHDAELHILALFVEPRHYGAVMDYVEQMLQRKEQSNLDLVASLDAAGIKLDYEKIKEGTPNGQVNRALIAAEMMRLGYCGSVKEAFSLWLSKKHGYFHPPRRLDALETIRFIKSIGAVAVLAHPLLNMDERRLRQFLPEAVAAGLDGMEVYYPKFGPERTKLAENLAEEFGLLFSGGSDFHGENKPEIGLGTGMDNLQIPLELLERLAERAQKN